MFKNLFSSRLFKIILIVLVLLLIFFIFLSSRDVKDKSMSVQVAYGDISETVLATGKLEAFKKVEVGAQVSGQIEKMYVSIGDKVKSGQLLAEIDPRTWQNQLNIAQARLNSDLAQLNSKQALYRQAKQELTRQKALYQVGAIAKKTFQAAQVSWQNAQSDLTFIREQIKQSKINVDNAQLNLGYTKLIAPIDGTVISAPAEAGQTLNANQNTPNVVTIAQLDKMTVKAEISEADVVRVRPEMNAYFTLLGDGAKKYPSILRRIDPAPQAISDNGRLASNTAIYYYGLFDVDNPDGVLRIGMTANVVIKIKQENHVLLLPINMLEKPMSEKKQTVRVRLAQGDIEQRTITLGLSDGINVAIKEGLKEGEEVLSPEVGHSGLSKAAEKRINRRMMK